MKKFIDKKVLDWKFKKAGEGHALSEEKGPPPSQPSSSKPSIRHAPSESSQSAGIAALARLETQGNRGHPSGGIHGRGSGSSSMRPELSHISKGVIRTEDVGKKRLCSQLPGETKTPEVEVVDIASSGIIVHVVCPVCQQLVPNSEIMNHLTSCLQEGMKKEPLVTSVQMIHTLCRDTEKRKVCVDTISKYLENIISHPGEEKYCKIRLSNKVFQERVVCVKGALSFLEAVGFHRLLLPHQDKEEEFLVLPKEKADITSDLAVCKELLVTSEPLVCKVDRNLLVLQPSFTATNFALPDSFFKLTVDEIRKEQRERSDKLERDSVLRTRAMRERDEIKMVVRHYRFSLIRVRMPDGFILQGIFRPMEKLRDVRAFVSECLVCQTHVFFFSVLGKVYTDDDMSLALLGLVPSAVLNFTWDTSSGPIPDPPFLKQDVLIRVQDIP